LAYNLYCHKNAFHYYEEEDIVYIILVLEQLL
jgi:hypothetical protein